MNADKEVRMESADDHLSRLEHFIEAWVAEKSQHVLEGVSELYEEIHKRDGVPPEITEAVEFWLSPVIYDATKLLAFATDKEWSTEDRDAICDHGRSGLEQVLVKYGLLCEDQTTTGRQRVQAQSLLGNLEELRALLNGPPYPSRTMIHEVLLQVRLKDQRIDALSELTERVAMGELSWEEYRKQASVLLENVVAEYRQTGRNAGHSHDALA